jgi:hypothetical protein
MPTIDEYYNGGLSGTLQDVTRPQVKAQLRVAAVQITKLYTQCRGVVPPGYVLTFAPSAYPISLALEQISET